MTTTDPQSSTEVIYQIEIHVEKEFADEYLEWLEKEHIKDLLELDNSTIFSTAEILQPIDEDPAAQTRNIIVQYRAISNEKLQFYFKTYADKMRGKVAGKSFDGKFTASRKVLKERSITKGIPQSNTFGYVF